LSIEIVGWAALVMTQVFWIPNIARILRTRDVEGYSLFAWLIMVGGLTGWLIYFSAKGDVVGIVANISGVTGGLITTFCIWFWGRGKKAAVGSHAQQPHGLGEPLTSDQG
jgi:uncharacterized protein with PQ loop repeat